MNFKNFQLDKAFSWQLCLIFCLCAALFTISLDAFATTTNADAISNVLCAIVAKFNGPLGKGIATIAIIVLGVGLFLGKLSWPVAVATAIGIVLIFGAGQMVSWISGAGQGSASADATCPTS